VSSSRSTQPSWKVRSSTVNQSLPRRANQKSPAEAAVSRLSRIKRHAPKLARRLRAFHEGADDLERCIRQFNRLVYPLSLDHFLDSRLPPLLPSEWSRAEVDERVLSTEERNAIVRTVMTKYVGTYEDATRSALRDNPKYRGDVKALGLAIRQRADRLMYIRVGLTEQLEILDADLLPPE
jgi:hypothetical protein